MKLPRIAGAAAGLLIVLVWAGCGDTFRPVVNPINRPGGDPQALELAFVLYEGVPLPSGTCAGELPPNDQPPCPGAVQTIDVTGDSNINTRFVGRTPVYLTLISGTQVYTVNRADESLSSFFPLSGAATSTISLPAGAAPSFLAGGGIGLYVANSGLNSVSVVSPSQNALLTTVPVGANPVAVAVSPDNKKVYVANRDGNSVSVINTADNTVAATISVGTAPVFVVPNSKLNFVYVLNQGSGSLSVIDNSNDTVAATVDLPGAAGSNFMAYDSQSQRLYVTNPGSQSVTVLDASQNTPVVLKTVTDARLSNPRAVAPLPDGTRAYVVDAGSTTGCAGEADMGRVLEIATSNNTVSRCITVGKAPVWIAASGDSNKVLVPHQAATISNGTVTIPIGTTIVQTATGQVVADMPAPFTDSNCSAEGANCIRMNPVLVVATP
ncbi:MAG: YncE family protein [Terriglobales bacterium]